MCRSLALLVILYRIVSSERGISILPIRCFWRVTKSNIERRVNILQGEDKRSTKWL